MKTPSTPKTLSATTVVVTGVGLALPGVDVAGSVLAGKPRDAQPVDPAARVGKKGLRYKDRATRLAYCAAADALADSGLMSDGELTVDSAGIGVVASSNLGNADTVVRALDTIAAETVTGTSPMDLPNASSNVIASSVAIRYGLRGPNLMVCNGETSGLDALRWAATMLVTGRAQRMLVLGVEPDTEPVRRLLAGQEPFDGAVALIVENAAAAAERGVSGRATLGRSVRAASVEECLQRLTDAHGVPPQTPRRDLNAEWGRSSGALGVLACAAAVEELQAGASGPVYTMAGGDGSDATAGLAVLAGPAS